MQNTRANKGIYYAGDHKVQCDVCGFVYLRSECQMTWNNLLSCPECYDPKQPQLNIRGKADKQAVRDARPESDDNINFGYPDRDEI